MKDHQKDFSERLGQDSFAHGDQLRIFEWASRDHAAHLRGWSNTLLNDHILFTARDGETLLNQLRSANAFAKHLEEVEADSKKLNDALKEIMGEGTPTIQDFYKTGGFARLLSECEAKFSDEETVPCVVKIVSPPGAWMSSFAGLVYSNKTCERVFEPILADFRHEYFEELRNSASPAKLRFVQVRHWTAFILAVLNQAITSAASVIQAFKSAG